MMIKDEDPPFTFYKYKDVCFKINTIIIIFMMEFRYCQYCNVKSFARIDNFKRHETVCFANPNRINFFCDVCGKKFSRKDNLNTHLTKLHKQNKIDHK